MPKMRAVQVAHAGGPLELVEREIPEPESGAVRIKVQACGVCHSDSVTKDGLFPGIQYPRVPGHEVIGVIDAVGANVPRWKVGERVGVGWNGGYCGYCDTCRRGNFFACETSTLVTGVTRDGGYADYMIAPASALALVPEELSAEEAAPLMCAGVTTFNCLRNSGARPGDRGGGDRLRWPRPSRYSIRGQKRIQHRRHRRAGKTRKHSPESWAPPTTSIMRPRILLRNC